MQLTFSQSFGVYVKSGFPIIVVPTKEVDRATATLFRLTQVWNKKLGDMKLPPEKENLKVLGYDVMKWDCVNGWRDMVDTGGKVYEGTNKQPHEGLKWLIGDQPREGVYIMENAHMFFGDTYTLPELVQLFREHYAKGKLTNRHLFLVGDSSELPPELQTLSVIVDFPLPSREELADFIEDYVEEMDLKIPKKMIVQAADAASGMTTHEVESAVCVAVVKSKGKEIDRNIVFEEKAKAVKRTGLLELMRTDVTLDSVGGLENFKEWMTKMSKPFLNPEAARKYGLEMPKGILVAGVSGTGKSLVAKATANLLQVPLFRLDIGRVFGGLVGETERKTRQLIELMEAVAPATILLDEIEKGLAGLGSSDSTDSGVTARLFGQLLFWMQEKTAPVFLVATANQVDKLPPEMLRKGRWSELWFVDLPTEIERRDIIRIHISKSGRDLKKFNGYERLAGEPTAGFTGAELEAVIKQAMFEAFADGGREFTLKDIEQAISVTVPLIKTKAAEIDALRRWADNKARAANRGEVVSVSAIPTKKRGTIFIDPEDDPQALAQRKRRA